MFAVGFIEPVGTANCADADKTGIAPLALKCNAKIDADAGVPPAAADSLRLTATELSSELIEFALSACTTLVVGCNTAAIFSPAEDDTIKFNVSTVYPLAPKTLTIVAVPASSP